MGCVKRTPKIRLSSVLSRYALLDSGLYHRMLVTIEIIGNMEVWPVSNVGSKFVAMFRRLVVKTICHSHRTVIHIQHLHNVLGRYSFDPQKTEIPGGKSNGTEIFDNKVSKIQWYTSRGCPLFPKFPTGFFVAPLATMQSRTLK